MSERSLRIVQVGVAPTGIGTTWLSLLQKTSDWELAGVVDVVPENRAHAAATAGLTAAQCFGSIAEAARAVDFDAVVVVVPSPLHADLCVQALQAGKHVLVEKPFTVELAQARAVVELAEQRRLQVMVDQNYRYMPDLQALRRALRDKVGGRPSCVSITFRYDWPPRGYQAGMANTMLLEMAIHHFDALRFVLDGNARTVRGQTWRPPWTSYAGDTWVTCSFVFPDDVHAVYHGTLEAPGAKDHWQGIWRVDCECGSLILGDRGQGYGLYLIRSPETAQLIASFDPVPDPGSAIAGTLREFAVALREGRRPQSNGRDNLQTLAMAFGVSRSSVEGRVVDLGRTFFAGLEEETP